jgi:uncharacterized protein
MTHSVLGKGLDFPYRFRLGRLAQADEAESVEAAMRMLFATPKGARFMLPQYGSSLPHLLFEPCDEATAARAEVYVTEAINEWIPRVARIKVIAAPNIEERAIRIRVDYVLAGDPTVRSLIYPFYLR